MASGSGSGGETTPPPPSTGHNSSRRGSPTGIRSYLQPVTALDNESRDTLKALLRVTVELRRSTSQTHRIRRGSPGAGALSSALTTLRPRVTEIADQLSNVFTTYDSFPGMYLVSTQFPVFREVLNSNFNDGGNDPGYSDRVRLLEKLMYVTGMLRGHVEMVLEQHGYWRAKLAGEQPSRLARRLNFNQDVDPAQASVFAVFKAPEPVEAPTPKHTFKVSVSLPQEAQTALASLWEEQKYNDIVFLISGQRVPAHKVVLAAQSEYFERLLYGEMKEASMGEIALKDVPILAFRKVLQFAYTGTLHMEDAHLQAMLEVTSVADRFGFVALKQALGDQFSQNHISLDTVLLLLVHSDMYHLPQLHKGCLAFIEDKSHTTDVLNHDSLLDLPEESLIGIISRDTFVAPEIEIFEAVKRWKQRNDKGVKEMAKVLKCVRLSEFSSAKQVFEDVEPTGLLDEKSILAAARVLCKPSVTEMQPRGRKERNRNLFTNPKVVFDSTTPPNYHQPLQHVYPHQAPPQLYVADTVIELGTHARLSGHGLQHGLQLGVNVVGRRLAMPRSSMADESTMIVSLDDLYIINYLQLKGYPSVSDEEQLRCKSFSYVVSVSRDKQSWMELFDYSSFACRGAQHLPFPRQAARYIRMVLKWREDTSQPLPLQFSACCFEERKQRFTFLPKGVIAPHYDQDVVTVPSSEAGDGSGQVCFAHFRQPYSAANITFSLECSEEDVTSVDITVSVGLSRCGGGGGGGGGQKDRVKVQDFDKTPLQSPVSVKIEERVISYVAVTIRKVHRKVPTPKEENKSDSGLGATAEQEENENISVKKENTSADLVPATSDSVPAASAAPSSDAKLGSVGLPVVAGGLQLGGSSTNAPHAFSSGLPVARGGLQLGGSSTNAPHAFSSGLPVARGGLQLGLPVAGGNLHSGGQVLGSQGQSLNNVPAATTTTATMLTGGRFLFTLPPVSFSPSPPPLGVVSTTMFGQLNTSSLGLQLSPAAPSVGIGKKSRHRTSPSNSPNSKSQIANDINFPVQPFLPMASDGNAVASRTPAGPDGPVFKVVDVVCKSALQ